MADKDKRPTLALLEAPTVVKRKRVVRHRPRKDAVANATRAIGAVEPGCEIFGFTKGQFSLTDIILHVLTATGPADVVVSTWTAAHADIQTHHRLLTAGGVRSMRFVIDRGFPSRQPEYCDLLVSKFGPDCIRLTRIHAKFVLIRNEQWSVAIRTSMNLNTNPRFENFEISDDPVLADFLTEIVEEIFAREDCGVKMGGKVDIPRCDSAFKELWSGRTDSVKKTGRNDLPAFMDVAARRARDQRLVKAK